MITKKIHNSCSVGLYFYSKIMKNIPNYALLLIKRLYLFLANLCFMLTQKYQVFVSTQALLVFVF